MTAIHSGPRNRSLLPGPTTPKHVGVVWAMLLVNTLGYTEVPMVIPFPRAVGQIVTMGALLLALALAVVLNPRLRVYPSPYLLLLTLLLLMSITSSLRLESGWGALFRCVRWSVFLLTLWLLSRWWRGDLSFVRIHIRALGGVLLVVAAGLVVSPGTALGDTYGGRLVGTLWPIPPPQVGQYAAVAAGLTIVLGVTRRTDGRSVALVVPPALVILLLSQTRTALTALVVGVLVALLTLTLHSAPARRAVMAIVVLAGLVAVLLGPVVQGFLTRGQDEEQLTSFTGRANVWDALLAHERTLTEQLIGVGLTNKSFGGLPIDSSWLAVYHEQGLVGVALVAAGLVSLLAAAALRPPSPARACAVFIVVYCAIASTTEVGLGDASPYFLHLVVAASLLAHRPSTGAGPVEIEPSDATRRSR